jgi:hypothetical protein
MSCCICYVQNDIGAGLIVVLRYPVPIFIPPIDQYSLIIVSSMLYNLDKDIIVNQPTKTKAVMNSLYFYTTKSAVCAYNASNTALWKCSPSCQSTEQFWSNRFQKEKRSSGTKWVSEWVSYITTDGQSASLSWCQAPVWGLRPDFIFIVRQLRVCWCGAPSLMRGRVCLLLCKMYNIFTFYMLSCVIYSLT